MTRLYARAKRLGRRLRPFLPLLLAAGLFLAGSTVLWAAFLPLPDLANFEDRKVVQSTKLYDRTGEVLLWDIGASIRRTVVSFDQISDKIKQATLAIEDAEFYTHRGIKPTAILRAVFVNLGSGELKQGGSTITQQVVKNAFLTTDKTFTRKLKEWILALKLERLLAKNEIFALYLNESPYGGTLYGVEEASRSFFGKSAADVTLAEAAYLAAIPKAPTYYSPYGPHRAELDRRKDLVLDELARRGTIPADEAAAAKKEKVVFLSVSDQSIRAPHFVMYVREQLERDYGEEAVATGGLRVTTTLDATLEAKAEDIAARYVAENEKKFKATNGALVGIDPKTGQILVMVGSRDYFDTAIDGNFNIALAERQPGSSFKPIVYATAFAKGYTPETVLFDVRTQFDTNCDAAGKPLSASFSANDCYTPENYDHVYRGPITLRNALAQSVNIPAIKTLYLVGIPEAIKTAKALGITSLTTPKRYGLTLVLGGGEVSLLELTGAYSVFANDGVRNPPVSILKVTDSRGDTLYEWRPTPEPAISPEVARSISSVLSDNAARAPAFGENSVLNLPGVAVKTGTTNDYRDAWIIGYTPSFAMGAWAGNNDNSPMEKQVAGFIVAPMWNAFMKEALATIPHEPFRDAPPVPADIKPVLRGVWRGNEAYTIDTLSGKLATTYTPEETRAEKVLANTHTILYWVDRHNPLGAAPTHPDNDPQFRLWEEPVATWVAANAAQAGTSGPIPTDTDDIHRPEWTPHASIITPAPAASFAPTDRITAKIDTAGSHYPIARADYYVNGALIGTTRTAPFSFSFTPTEISLRDENELRVVVTDTTFQKNEARTTFVVSENNGL